MRSIFVVIMICLGGSILAQMPFIPGAEARVNREGSSLARKLGAKTISSNREFLSRSRIPIGDCIVLNKLSFDHAGDIYTIEYQNDLSEDVIMRQSFLKISVHPQGQAQDKISFTDQLLNGSWDEYESSTSFISYDYISKDKDEELQKKFLELLKEALEYF
jgi:hypothetical protein